VASRESATELRKAYGVPESVRIVVEDGVRLAFVEGADDAVRAVASGPDDLPQSPDAVGRARLSRVDSALGPLLVRESKKGGLLRALRGRRFRGPFRPLSELVLLRRCAGAAVPVPEGVGCVVLGKPSSWRGFLLTKEIAGAVDLDAWLWRGVLHPKNLLLGRGGEVRVLDLDRARAFDRSLSEEDRLGNLVRLARAVEKQRLRGLRVSRRDALRFLEGYGGSPEAARRWLDRVRERLLRGLFLRTAWWRVTGRLRPRAGVGAPA
jgi:hypothetical protein